MKKIKKFAMNKIIVSSLCLILLLLFTFFPTKERINIEVIETNNKQKNDIYLLDEDDYVSKVNVYFDSENVTENIRERINMLINGCNELDNFYPLIPKNTIINNIKVNKDSVYLDFSKELLNVNKYLEEKMIESIVYTVTEINGINNVYILVDGKSLTNYPNSNNKIEYPLTRKYGINKEYDINNFENINKTIVFFLKQDNNNTYYVPVTKISNIKDEKINIIISELKSSINSQKKLKNYINDNLKLLDYKNDNNILSITFNEYIYDNKTISNEVKELLTRSIFENYYIDKIIFKTEKNNNIFVSMR